MIEGNGFKILGTLTDQFDRAKGQKANAEDALAKYPDLGCMVGLFAYNPPLMLDPSPRPTNWGRFRWWPSTRTTRRWPGSRREPSTARSSKTPMYGYKSGEILSELAKGNKSVIPAGSSSTFRRARSGGRRRRVLGRTQGPDRREMSAVRR